MKKIIILILVLLISTTFSFASEIKTSPDNNLRFELISYNPSPVQPGDTFDVTIKVKNIERKRINNLQIDISESFPFTFVSGYQSQRFELLKPNQEKTFTFTLKTSPNANFGVEKLNFVYTFDELAQIRTETFNINIESIGKIVSIDSVETDPVRILPGEDAKLYINIENSGVSTLNDIVVKLNLSGPFNLLFTTNERRISSLAPGGEVKVEYNIITTSDAESKPYSFPLTIEYFDETGSKFARDNIIGILVYAPPQYEFNLEDSDVLAYGGKSKITISLSNIAPSNIRFLSTTLLDGEQYKVISNPKKYLGNLEPDDFETAEYEIYVNNCLFSCHNKLTLNLQLDYKDDYNKEFSVKEEFSVPAYKKRELKSLGLSDKNGKATTITIILLIIFIYLTIQHYRRERDLAKAIKEAFTHFIIIIFKIISYLRWRKLKRLPRKIRILWMKANDKGFS